MRTYTSKVCVAGCALLAASALSFITPDAPAGGPAKLPGKLKAKESSDPFFKAPVVTVIKNDFPKAKGWRITWKGGSWTSETASKIQSIFSTVTGGVNSVHYLNNTSPGNTDNADMQLFFGDLRATSLVKLKYDNHTRKTMFKLSGMKVADLEDAAKNDPAKFGVIYTLAFDKAALEKDDYKAGQIYVFKTDRVPVKYGAVRIVSMNPRTIEVVIQK